MYNKYIGNTGRFVRVEDQPWVNTHSAGRSAALLPPPDITGPQNPLETKAAAPPNRTDVTDVKSKSPIGGRGGGLISLFGGLGGGLGGLTSSFKGMFDHMPFGLDFGDILLFLLLFFFFIESGDEEFIIILGIIAYSMFKDR